MQETWVQSLGWEGPLEKEMATHFSILAWRILWTEEPGRLQSMGLQSDMTERLHTHTYREVEPIEAVCVCVCVCVYRERVGLKVIQIFPLKCYGKNIYGLP